MTPTRTSPQRDFVLSHRLERVASQLRSVKFNRLGLFAWSVVAVVAAALAWLQRHVPVAAPWIVPVLVVVFIAATALTVCVVWRDRTGVEEAARHLARLHPELRSVLPAAVEQFHEPGGDFHFLQRRVINDALRHADRHNWLIRPRRHARWFFVGHLVALAAALALAGWVLREHRPIAARRAVPAHGIEITPGDAELERGSSVVVAARFGDSPPSQASLVSQPAGGTATRISMSRSLSDPVFAATLPGLISDVAYHVEYDGQRSRTFALRVFDLPALTRADAALEFPAYTGLAPRKIVDTRRVSAVVGTRLLYDFYVNKPVARAVLRTDGPREISLTPANAERTHFQLQETLARSEKLTLHLTDDAGRANRVPVDLRIEALENRRPEFKKLFPQGDQQVSPLEEMHLEAEVSDDFGLRDYGFGLGIADAAPTYVSLLPPHSAPASKAAFRHLLALESHGVKPDQLVTWFAWADDVGPDGEVRRSTSDVFFAQVRRLEEIFREDANGGGRNAPPGGGGPGDELLETQRQISIATWKLRQENSSAPNFTRDATTLRDSQVQAQKQLATLRERLEDDTARAAAAKAAPLMERAADSLGEAATKKSAAPLEAAWTAARGAYEALLRMQPRDTRVSRSQNGGQGGGNRNRDQLNELEFRQENDRYETETQAQPPPTPEQREQLGVLARLRELARRQEDLNRRVQELQTALAAADQQQQEAIRRELKRLEDEQRRLLSDVDETRQRSERLASGEQKQQVQQQLERTREDMRRASEQLGQGEVSQALAAGSRARETLQRSSEDLRQGNAGRFGDQMREARRQARELAAGQQKAAQQLDELSRGQQSLDDAGKREAIAQQFQEQAKRRESLLQNLRDITDESEGTEPRLHRQLYDLLRQQGQSGAANQLATSAELLRRGFVDPVQERQAGLQREFENLQRSVERAAGAVLGDETNELRFAQRELDELTRELGRDRPASSQPGPSEQPAATNSPNPGAANSPAAGDSPRAGETKSGEKLAQGDASPTRAPSRENSGSPDGTPGNPRQASQPSSDAPSTSAGKGNAGGQGGSARGEDPEQLARAFGTGAGAANDRTTRGPLTGGGFADWAERLRTVEDLIEEPGPRQQIASARFQAEELRRANQRDGQAPRWDLVEMGIVAPLQDARAWLREELNRRDEPDALHPIDRDPVPERYAESVRKYYEALGTDSGKRVK